MIGVVALLMLSAACGTSPSVVAPVSELRSDLPTPLPAGRWAFDDLEHTSCVDCPTPRFAVVAAQGSLPEVTRNKQRWTTLPAGYPFVVARGELGLRLAQPYGLVVGLYRGETDARRAESVVRGSTFSIPDRAAVADRSVVEITSERAPAYGRESIGSMGPQLGYLEDGAPAKCQLPRGALFAVEVDDVHRVADATPWVAVRCPDGLAFVASTHTDLGRTVEVLDDGHERWTQPAGGVCGVTHMHRVELGRGAERRETELSSHPSCVEDGPVGIDVWSVCPGGTLDGCIDRARRVAAAGDRRHALRLASYACRFGAEAGCASSAEYQEDPAVALWTLVEACQRFETDSACARLDSSLRAVDPADVTDEGSLALHACQRGHETWCAALDDSELCDRDGCG